MKEYLETRDPERQIRISTHYEKGGHSYFSSEITMRGYFLVVMPVTKTPRGEMFTAYSGVKKLLIQTVRQSVVGARLADGNARQAMRAMVDAVLAESKLTLTEAGEAKLKELEGKPC